jgi:hypothetical protein
LYIFLIIAALGMRTTILRRSLVKNIHIISLAFEMRTPSGIRLDLTLVQFILADKDPSPRSNLREACAGLYHSSNQKNERISRSSRGFAIQTWDGFL